MHNIEIRPLAATEIIEAYDWYESQQEGLGFDFLNELENFFGILQQNPLTFSYYSEPVRQGRINRFPYVVVFEVFGNTVIVYSVFMTKQSPDKKREY